MPDRIYIVDNRYYDTFCKTLGKGLTVLPSATCKSLDAPVSAHPDMVLFTAEKGEVICAKEVYEEYQKILSSFGIKLVQGAATLHRDYPNDVAYNVLSTPCGVFAKFESTDKQIIDLLEKNQIRKTSVRQGYARCSTLSFGKALISADSGIIKAGRAAGLSVLSITPGFVKLPGYDYGFIGGASGVLADDTVAFFGDLSLHPDGKKIRDFITEKGFFIKEVIGQPLTDIGTIFCIEL